MARYDKYDPISGGFRAPLAAAVTAANKNKVYAVGLDSAGRVVLGAGQSGIVGVLVTHDAKVAGDIVDVMTDGEIVEFTLGDGTSAAAAGTVYYGVAADGTYTATVSTNTRLGHTVEAKRLVVRAAR